jgi:hypothetical protein
MSNERPTRNVFVCLVHERPDVVAARTIVDSDQAAHDPRHAPDVLNRRA